MQWSIGYSLPAPHLLRTNGGQVLVNHVELCSNELLAEVAESEDFERGLLWLSAVGATDEDQVLSIVMELESIVMKLGLLSPIPSTSNTEVLLLLDDAHTIHWLHPGRDVNRLEGELLAMTRRFGWRLSKERPERLMARGQVSALVDNSVSVHRITATFAPAEDGAVTIEVVDEGVTEWATVRGVLDATTFSRWVGALRAAMAEPSGDCGEYGFWVTDVMVDLPLASKRLAANARSNTGPSPAPLAYRLCELVEKLADTPGSHVKPTVPWWRRWLTRWIGR
jgi:hypothetical protein